jgi:hypothetical protein
VKGLNAPTAVAADGANVYYSTADAIARCPATLSACTPEVLATGQSAPADLALDAHGVYWTDTPGSSVRVQTCPTSGCGAGRPLVLALVPGAAPAQVAVVDAYAYFSTGGPGGAIFRVAR